MASYSLYGIVFSSNNDLYHYGIKGQKWGERRFQNKDGTLTPAGKERYKTGDDSVASRENGISKLKRKILGRSQEEDNLIRKEKKERREANKRIIKDAANVHKMSDSELLAKIGRLQNEKRLMELSYDRLTSSANPAKQQMIKAGKKALEIALPGVALYSAYGLVTGNWNPAELARYAFPNPNAKKK